MCGEFQISAVKNTPEKNYFLNDFQNHHFLQFPYYGHYYISITVWHTVTITVRDMYTITDTVRDLVTIIVYFYYDFLHCAMINFIMDVSPLYLFTPRHFTGRKSYPMEVSPREKFPRKKFHRTKVPPPGSFTSRS